MGIVISESINDFSNSMLSYPIISDILNNPMYTAFIMAVSIILIMMFIFRNEEIDDFSRLTLRTGVYSFLAIMAILFLYNKKIRSELREQIIGGDESRILSAVQGGSITSQVFDDDIVPVTIRTSFETTSTSLNEPTSATDGLDDIQLP